ncbi:MAG: flavin monoamine oxidase family protein [Gammaproteobacteria bacterium]
MEPTRFESLTRRQFVNLVGKAGGFGAAYLVMQGLGLLPDDLVHASPPELEPGSGGGSSVVILGAGLAGLTAAYLLGKAGYDCHLLEARERVGGRCWTLRRGDSVEERGHARQVCEFDDGLYFNPGPARIPANHSAVLGYCREFGVELEVFVNANRSAMFQDDEAFGGKPIESRQLHSDTAGHIAELLVKATDSGALDEVLGGLDRRRLLYFFKHFGALDENFRYRGSSRAGFEDFPGAGLTPGRGRAPLAFEALVDSRFWYWHMGFEKTFEQQATMLQPVGGMDEIARAFESRLVGRITYGAQVREIRKRSAGVRVVFGDRVGAGEKTREADFCICTIPLPVLKSIDSDFDAEHRTAIADASYTNACKLAWQSQPRFWEDRLGIYGGISWTQREITQIWYPSSGFHGKSGILIGAYNFDPLASEFGKRSIEERAALSRDGISLFHPGMASKLTGPISVAWQNIPYNESAFASWGRRGREQVYPILNRPDGRIYLAGEHLSYWTSWQEGAVRSAHAVSAAIDLHMRSLRA